MSHENLCVLSGCMASCCHDISIPWEAENKTAETIFPTVTRISFWGQWDKEGVYALTDENNRTTIYIIGPCPHNNPTTFACMIPGVVAACKRTPFLGKDCRDARQRDGNTTIDSRVYYYAAE